MSGEKRIDLVPYGVRYICECGTEMTYANDFYPDDPIRYIHNCEACGARKLLPKAYPVIQFDWLDEIEPPVEPEPEPEPEPVEPEVPTENEK